MTLSRAEYFWPDLKRILEKFILHAEGRKDNLELDHSTLNNVLHDYTLVVQEFFTYMFKNILNQLELMFLE